MCVGCANCEARPGRREGQGTSGYVTSNKTDQWGTHYPGDFLCLNHFYDAFDHLFSEETRDDTERRPMKQYERCSGEQDYTAVNVTGGGAEAERAQAGA